MSYSVTLMSICVWVTLHQTYAYNNTIKGRLIKNKIILLANELYGDAQSKVNSFGGLSQIFWSDQEYHLGVIIYRARKTHAKMRRLYRQSNEDVENWKIDKHTETISHMHRYESHIDHLVQMCLRYENMDSTDPLQGRYLPDFPTGEDSLRTKKASSKDGRHWAAKKTKFDNVKVTNANKDNNGDGFDSDY